MRWLERRTGQNGLWWLWHLSATVQLGAIIGLLALLVVFTHQLTLTQQETATAQREAAFYARHAACGSLFTVASMSWQDPWEFWQQVTGKDSSVCQQDTR